MHSISTKKHNKPYISVVIAVYNVEKYIARCCQSLFRQTLENIEYIFVDDCSPDNSIEIVQSVLNDYPQRTNQVKIIKHSTNRGVSKTREEGIKNATGEYIIHCDPDDWIELDMYERLYNKAVTEKADIVLCDLWYHYYNDPISYYGKEEPKEKTSRSVLASCLHAQFPLMNCYLWNKMVKANCYSDVKWPDKISFCEDVIACVQLFKKNDLRISYEGKAFYHYAIKEESLSHRRHTKQDIENDYTVISILYSCLCDSNDMEMHRIWQACVTGFMVSTLEAPERYYTNKEYTERYRKYRNCIGKNLEFSKSKKALLYVATYNYWMAFTIFKAGKQLRSLFRMC